jgi:hypothetical protein
VIEPRLRRQSLQNGNIQGFGRRLSPFGALRLLIWESGDEIEHPKSPRFRPILAFLGRPDPRSKWLAGAGGIEPPNMTSNSLSFPAMRAENWLGFVSFLTGQPAKLWNWIALPKPLQSGWQGLCNGRSVDVFGVVCEQKLVVIAFCGQHFGHQFGG